MYSARFQPSPNSDAPDEVQQRAAEAAKAQQEERKSQLQYLSDALQSLSAGYEKELYAIIGEGYLGRYREFRDSMRKRLRDNVERAEPTVVGEQTKREDRDQAIQESRDFMREIGFDMAKASAMRGEYHRRVEKAMSDAIGGPAESNFMLPPDVAGPLVVAGDTPRAIYRPPYLGRGAYCEFNKQGANAYGAGGDYIFLQGLDGLVGSVSQTAVFGADDLDWAAGSCHRAHYMAYTSPAAGRINVWAKLSCPEGVFHSGSLQDEWGWSDSLCRQASQATFTLFAPGTERGTSALLLYYQRSGTDAFWSNEVCLRGNHGWVNMVSSGSHPAGTRMLLAVGTEDWNAFWSNDVTVRSYMWMHRLLEEVQVTVLPD
jgi:hypothetical protein